MHGSHGHKHHLPKIGTAEFAKCDSQMHFYEKVFNCLANIVVPKSLN